MPLELFDISNFQGLDSLTMVPDPQITTIVGPTDVGKSSSLRALRWICTNTPSGDGFIRFGSKGTDCLLKVDGHVIIRKRMKDGENLYVMDGVEYRAFGQTVPEPIKQVLGLSDLNFVDQHDPQYWFTLSAGEVSRQLNNIVDLGIIDETLYNVGKEVRRFQEDVRVNKDRLQKSKERKESLEWTEIADDELKKIEQLYQNLLKLQEKRTDAEVTLGDIRDAEHVRDTLKSRRQDTAKVGKLGERAMAISDRIDQCAGLVENIWTLEARVKRRYPVLDELEKCWNELRHVRTKIGSIKNLTSEIEKEEKIVAKGCPDISPLVVLYNRFQEVRQKRMGLESLISSISHAGMKVESTKIAVQKSQEALQRESEGLCPICGNELK